VEEERLQKDNIGEIIEELLDRGDKSVLKNVLLDLHPADIAEAVTRLDRENRNEIFRYLDITIIAEVIVELDHPVRKEYLEELDIKRLVEIIGVMDSDDATDVIGELEESVAQQVLTDMPRKEFREVKTLLRHDEETAGGIMALEIVAVDQDKNSRQALEVLRRKASEVEDVYNIYVVDGVGVLKGIVSLKDLVLADSKKKLSDIMDKEAISVHPEMDQEEVANLFHKYDLVAAPVVNQNGVLIGRITVDDVLDVVEEEASEDITLMAGITDEKLLDSSVFRRSGVRLPWLLVAFVGEMVSAVVLSHFHVTIVNIAAAAFFIPLIMAMGGNAGIQSATVVIRGMATGDIDIRDTGKRVIREVSTAFLNGLIISILLFCVVAFWQNKPKLGLILAFSMMAVIFNAAFLGTIIPFLLKRFGIDPAIATGPFITTSNDVFGLLIYFGMITVFLS
jgi:magnesium transporter